MHFFFFSSRLLRQCLDRVSVVDEWEGGGGVGEGQTKRQIVGSLDMSSSLHRTKEIYRDALLLDTADPERQPFAQISLFQLMFVVMMDYCEVFGPKRGSSRTNTGLGGVTPCTQLCLPMLPLAYEPPHLPHSVFPPLVSTATRPFL